MSCLVFSAQGGFALSVELRSNSLTHSPKGGGLRYLALIVNWHSLRSTPPHSPSELLCNSSSLPEGGSRYPTSLTPTICPTFCRGGGHFAAHFDTEMGILPQSGHFARKMGVLPKKWAFCPESGRFAQKVGVLPKKWAFWHPY